MFQTLAYVISSAPSGDFDRRYSLYCERFGKITATAKGIRKIQARLSGHLEPPHLVWVGIVEGKGNGNGGKYSWQIAQALEKEDFYASRSHPESLKEILRVNKIFDFLVQGSEEDSAMWHLWEEFLGKMEEAAENGRPFSAAFLADQFLLRLLDNLGLWPGVTHCTSCGRELNRQGFFVNGEFFCAACAPNLSGRAKMPPEVFKALDRIQAEEWLGGGTVEQEIRRVATESVRRASLIML